MAFRRAVLAVAFPGAAAGTIEGPATVEIPPGPDWLDWRAGPAPDVAGALAGLDGPVLLRGPGLARSVPAALAALDRAGWAASALLVVRHPSASALALEAAHGLAPNEAMLLWLRCALEAERATRSVPRAGATHDAMVADGQGILDRAGLGVPLRWHPGGHTPDAEPDGPPAGSAYADVWCRHAWAALRRLATTGRDGDAEAALDRVAAQFDDACRLFGPPRPRPRLPLPGVTLCAADSRRVALTLRALRHCAALCAFDDVLLLTDAAVAAPGRVVPVPPIRSREDYSAVMLHGLAGHIRTDHVLLVQWDGFVVDPASWDDSFRRYDYIGSRWADFRDGSTVGNGGFSLRSRRLLRALADPRLRPDPTLLEDQQICRAWRPFLEREHGITFAPPEVADRFSYERIWPGGPAFGFHGLFNLWRHADDEALLAVAALLPPDVLCGREFGELAVMCWACGRPDAFRALATVWREAASAELVAATVRRLLTEPPGAADRCLAAAGLR